MSIVRQILIIVLLSAIAGGGYAYHSGEWNAFGKRKPENEKVLHLANTNNQKPDKVLPVVSAQASLKTFVTSIEAIGTTRPLKSVRIVAFSSGRVMALNIKSGHLVETNTVLVELDSDIQVADFAEANAKLDLAKRAASRAKKLLQNQNIPEARVIELRTSLATAQAEKDRAKKHLLDRTVRAPFAGRIGIRQVDVGAWVDKGTVIATLDDMSSIEIEASISEVHFPKVHEGAAVTAQSAAFEGRFFSGKITTIDKRIDPDSRAFQIRIRVPNADSALPAGMFMQISIDLDKRSNPAIPEEALIVQAREKFVYVIDGDKVSSRPVRLGQRRDGVVEIVEGVNAIDIVVVEGMHRLKDGANIKIVSGPGAEILQRQQSQTQPASSSSETNKDGS